MWRIRSANNCGADQGGDRRPERLPVKAATKEETPGSVVGYRAPLKANADWGAMTADVLRAFAAKVRAECDVVDFR